MALEERPNYLGAMAGVLPVGQQLKKVDFSAPLTDSLIVSYQYNDSFYGPDAHFDRKCRFFTQSPVKVDQERFMCTPDVSELSVPSPMADFQPEEPTMIAFRNPQLDWHLQRINDIRVIFSLSTNSTPPVEIDVAFRKIPLFYLNKT